MTDTSIVVVPSSSLIDEHPSPYDILSSTVSSIEYEWNTDVATESGAYSVTVTERSDVVVPSEGVVSGSITRLNTFRDWLIANTTLQTDYDATVVLDYVGLVSRTRESITGVATTGSAGEEGSIAIADAYYEDTGTLPGVHYYSGTEGRALHEVVHLYGGTHEDAVRKRVRYYFDKLSTMYVDGGPAKPLSGGCSAETLDEPSGRTNRWIGPCSRATIRDHIDDNL